MNRYAIGVDYGTQSVRAILVDIYTGETVAESVSEYAHGFLTEFPGVIPPSFALQDPMDYLNGLIGTVSDVMDKSGVNPETVVGLAIDATASTLLPVDRNKKPLSEYPEFRCEPHAWLKLWKHHGGEEEAARMTEIAAEMGEPWLARYGGKISSEWSFPKVLETLHCAPQVLEKADSLLEVMDWLTWILTDNLTVSGCGRGYKALYVNGTFPSDEYLARLDPRLPDIVHTKMNQPVLPIGSKAGSLCPEMAAKLHLLLGTPVGTPIIDAHSSVLGGGITGPGQMMIIMGTSACHLMLTDREERVPGIQGIVRDGIMPGWSGIEAGQSCVGDQFEWAVRNCFPESYALEARTLGLSPHQLLTQKLEGVHAGDTGLIALDWLNGVRSPLMDFELSGLIVGLNLRTKPEEIYMALVESTAFGTRTILESFENAGLPVREIILGGGIPGKNPFVVRTFANVLRRPVRICASTQASALGAAMLGICAAPESVTGYRNLAEITGRLGRVQRELVQPELTEADTYDQLYADYMELHRFFGRVNPGLMHRLTRMHKKMPDDFRGKEGTDDE